MKIWKFEDIEMEILNVYLKTAWTVEGYGILDSFLDDKN